MNNELGGDRRGLGLFGSRARRTAHPESDVDNLGIAEGGRDRYGRIVSEEVAIAEGESPFNFSVHVHDRDRMRDRRTIESFFIQKVDRDKIVSDTARWKVPALATPAALSLRGSLGCEAQAGGYPTIAASAIPVAARHCRRA